MDFGWHNAVHLIVGAGNPHSSYSWYQMVADFLACTQFMHEQAGGTTESVEPRSRARETRSAGGPPQELHDLMVN